VALFYRSRAEYLSAISTFLHASRSGGTPVLVAVRPGVTAELDGELTDAAGQVTLIDMAELGRNPARIIPAILSFARRHRGRQVCCISEPIWPGRTAAEIREATRHEALTNLAFRDTQATIVCPYDMSGLAKPVLADAACTHPVVISAGREQASAAYLKPPRLPPRCDRALPSPPAHAESLRYGDNLGVVRKRVATAARSAGLAPPRLSDLVIAISELAANTLLHTTGGGMVHIWRSGGETICQIEDSGQIADLLARHRAPAADSPGGKGLWLVNQMCDLVQARSGPAGTTTRLHMRLN
jgi:anti-sigma regulatory factor (Ser/Thr protein kinase)